MPIASRRSLHTLALASTICCLGAHATEGGGGRSITGQQVSSAAGIVPPEPGWIVTLESINFDGDIKGDKEVPVLGTTSLGMKARLSFNMTNVTYVWNTGPGRWNFASAVGLPFQVTDINFNLTTPRHDLGTGDNSTEFADMLFTPIVAGYHFSKTEHIAFSLPIFAPTGNYDKNRLANAGQNVWTFMPSMGYTKLGADWEFSALTAFEFYTRNDATDYHSGDIFRLDALWTTHIATGWQAGVVGGWIQQFTDDTGPTADRLDGFRGHSLGLGPIANWSGKLGSTPSTFSARWVYDVDAKNRLKGNGIAFSLNLMLF